MSTCFFDFGYPRNFKEAKLMLKNLKHGSLEDALKMYNKTGFFDVPALYENVLHEALNTGKAQIGYLYLPPYLSKLNNCKKYVSLIPFISSSTQTYLKNIGINEFEELGKNESFIKTWENKINSKSIDKVCLIFHSAPIEDKRYENKLKSFKAKLEKYTGKNLSLCFVSSRNGWLGPSLAECSKEIKNSALTGFLFESAEVMYEAKEIDAELLKLDLDDVKSILFNYV